MDNIGNRRKVRLVEPSDTLKVRWFTLVELLVVIAIIGVLMALLLPALSRAKGMASSAACKSNQHQLAVAIMQYTGDNNSYFMPVGCYLYNGNVYATPSQYWQAAGWPAPWGYWCTGAFCDLAPTGPPWAPSWMDYAYPYFENRVLVRCPNWKWHKLGVCQSNIDRYQYGYGGNCNVLPMWDFNQFDNSGGPWVRIPGRPAIRPSRVTRFADWQTSTNSVPSNKIMIYDRLRSDRMDTWFSNIDIGGMSFWHPLPAPKPPDNDGGYFTRAVIGSGYANCAFADGHVGQVSVGEFAGKL